ncbi:CRISPR-associated protein Cas5 [Allosphingosinicella indica]|uniref:CRISPR-associated protein Cas5 n=1 Tax=Allosphingosinicella indica TaxID=941907 RepID=UPI0018D3C4BF|nr:CRISPR-associated protein Cas5 [Allosphingosinicella indica]
MSVRLRVVGPMACFARPEIREARVSYDVMTPYAARAILEAIHWKPAIRWIVDSITIFNPVRFDDESKSVDNGSRLAARERLLWPTSIIA